jgi:hypothetical protein
MMLDNCSYNKIKLLHQLSSQLWFIQKHALQDAQAAGDIECIQMLQEIEVTLQSHLERLRQSLNVITQ